MPSTYLTELALRAAVNSNKRELTNDKGQIEVIKDIALKRSLEMIQGSTSGPEVNAQMDLQSIAISVAVKGLELAYTAISKQLDALKNQRLSFDKERQAGIGTFMVPTNKEETNLSKEEKVIKGFLKLVSENPSFSTYLGIHHAELTNKKGAKFYSILPFYRMSEALDQPVASTNPLDQQRTAINLFFKSALPDAIADIETSFQTDWKFIAFWESTFQRKNYLNNRRAPRFVMMSLSNLLWNLQHPVDPQTGLPLSLTRCIELCRDVEIFLNQLLNSETTPCLQKICNDENGLLSFMLKLELHTKILKAAYAQEQLHELNIDEITNSAHQALRIMDKSVFKLIYKRYDPVEQKDIPDEKAAEILADMVSYLNLLLTRNAELMNAFQVYPGWIPHTSGINKPPLTIIDALIIFCHLSWRERDHLLATIESSKMDSALQFSQTLRKFDLKFIKPIKAISKRELNATVFTPKHQDVSCLTARRLVPLLTLVVKDYRVELDTPLTYERAKQSQQNPIKTRVYSGKQQIQAINVSAEACGGYYVWALSPFIIMSSQVATEIDELPKRQYRLTQMTEILDSVSYLIKNYHSFLQNKIFQTFLLKCLNKVKEEYTDLDLYINKIDLNLAHDERMSRSLQAILRPMTRDLNSSLETFALATTNFEHLVNAPDFTDQQRQLLAAKISEISDQFSALFAEDSGISGLINPVPITQTAEHIVVTPIKIVEARKVLALKKLVQCCYNALSYQSREGHKGLLLRELSNMIEEKPNFTEGQIKHVIMELTRVTASYRETWIFQASYGQTRSAKALIAAIKDPSLNSVLPLASIIFDQSNINIMHVSDAQILQRLKSLREGNSWQESAKTIEISSI